MSKNVKAGVGLAAVLLLASPLLADTYNFTPNDPDLADLPHQTFFVWGVNWSVPTGQQIQSATLTYRNIYDWAVEPDRLYTHLLDSVPDPNRRLSPNYQQVGVPGTDRSYERITITGTDNQGGGDYFATNWQGEEVTLLMPDGTPYWSDPLGGSARNFNLAYDLSSYLDMLADGSFGIGIDPDCHYFNSGIVLTIETGPVTTAAVPAPAAGALAAIGLALLAWRLLARQA